MNRLEQLLFGYAVFVLLITVRLYFIRLKSLKWSLLDKGAVAGAVVGFLIGIDAFFVEPNWITTNVVVIPSLRLTAIAADITIVHLSDLHVRPTLRLREKLLVKKVNNLKPDLIVITGDTLEKPTEISTALELLKSMKPSIGTYVVLGNTDYRKLKQDQLAKLFKRAGVTPLINENTLLHFPNGAVSIAGVDDPVHKRDNLEKTLKGIPDGMPVILLSHSPEIYPRALVKDVDLILAGHTHGGQIGIPWLVKMSNYANRSPYMKGLFHDGKSFMYVNKGIGTKMFPIRFLCPPEITVLKFVVS